MASTSAPSLSHDAPPSYPLYDDYMRDVPLERRKQMAAVSRKILEFFRRRAQVTFHKNVGQSTINNIKINLFPTYDDCRKEVKKLTRKAATNPEFQQKIKEAFLKTTGSQDNLKAIHEGVNQFTTSITRINDTFDDIRAKLYAVNQLELKNRKGEIWEGVPRWVGLRNEWRSLLDESQSAARKSVTRCDDFLLFCEGILQIESVDDQLYKDTIGELEIFTKTPDPAGGHYNPEQATRYSPAFHKLNDALLEFKSDFSEYQGTRTDPVIRNLNQKIKVIEQEIASDVQMIISLAVASGAPVFTTLTGGVIAEALGPLSMGAVTALIIEALAPMGEADALAYFAKDWCRKGAQRDKWQSELREKEASQDALVVVMSKLKNQAHGLSFILSQIHLLKNVWYTISNEAYLILNRLTAATDNEALTCLQTDINAAKETYKELRISLAKYGSTI